jgi:hypothetical protein
MRPNQGNPKATGRGSMCEVEITLPPEEQYPDEEVPDTDVGAEASTNRRQLLAAGELLTLLELQTALSMSYEDVMIANREMRLFTVNVDGQEYYPAFFACSEVNRQVLERVSRELGALPGWVKRGFFNDPKDSLGGLCALEALARGGEELVTEIAARFVTEANE